MRLKIKWREGWAYVHGHRPDGKRYRRALKTKDASRAEELRSQIEAELWSVHMYGLKAVVTFDQAALEYAQDGGDTRFLVGITEQLTGMLLKDITPRIIRAAAKKAYPDGAGATLNRQGITPARAVINYAHGEGWCAPIRVKAFEVKKPKRKAVGYEYLLALQPHLTVERRFPNAPPYLFAMLLFLHTTGRRVGDAIKLTPDDIKWDINKAHIDKTKNGTEAYASLVPVLADMLREMPPRHGRSRGRISWYAPSRSSQLCDIARKARLVRKTNRRRWRVEITPFGGRDIHPHRQFWGACDSRNWQELGTAAASGQVTC